MRLESGQRLGHYEVECRLGEGGMGAVYRARDTRLGRSVALKVLRADAADDPELIQRLEREARVVSRLSHPNICALYDVGREDGIDFLVMEYLEGETLGERLQRGVMPLDEILTIGLDVAAALDAAHGQGLVHRDLKPGNVMLTPHGAKLLDFGLAKAVLEDRGPVILDGGDAAGPATALPMTAKGAIIGTVHYMAPEQLEGNPVDAQADLFAFGCLLYEMATLERAFAGDNLPSVMVKVLSEQPPPLRERAPGMPAVLERLVGVCLEKDPRERWSTAHDLALQLRGIRDDGSAPWRTAPTVKAPGRRRRWLRGVFLLTAGLATLALALVLAGQWPSLGAAKETPGSVVGAASSRPVAGPRRVVRFQVPLPAGTIMAPSETRSAVAVSPDGKRLALVAIDSGVSRIYLRELDRLETRRLEGTDGARSVEFSPDSRSLVFNVYERLLRVEATGGPVRDLGVVVRQDLGRAAWTTGDVIVFSTPRGLETVPASGGEPEVVALPATPGTDSLAAGSAAGSATTAVLPSQIPGTSWILYRQLSAGGGELRVASLDPGEVSRLPASGATNRPGSLPGYRSQARIVPPGILVYAQDGALYGRRIDLETLAPRGEPAVLADRIHHFRTTGLAHFAVSEDVLAYRAGRDVEQWIWVDRQGREVGEIGEPADYGRARLSPRGDRLAVVMAEQVDVSDLWVFDLGRGIPTRFTSSGSLKRRPVWVGEERLVFTSRAERRPNLWSRRFGDPEEERLLPPDMERHAADASRDGRYVIFHSRGDIFLLDLEESGVTPFLATEHSEWNARFSPDGRWIAFRSNETGRQEIYLARRDRPAARYRVSPAGGDQPMFRRDGREIFYRALDDRLMAVDVELGEEPEIGAATPLFALGGLWHNDVAPDGERFLLLRVDENSRQAPVTVVVGWQALVPD